MASWTPASCGKSSIWRQGEGMTVKLDGKVAVVTGASRGLGQRAALALARHGAQVALIARSAGQLGDTERQIAAAGGTALALPADVGDAAAVEGLQKRIEDSLGTVSILV